jgi:hypothetical protein
VEAPNLLDLIVVQSHFETKRLARIGSELAQTFDEFIQIVGDGHDLSAQDSYCSDGRCGGSCRSPDGAARSFLPRTKRRIWADGLEK